MNHLFTSVCFRLLYFTILYQSPWIFSFHIYPCHGTQNVYGLPSLYIIYNPQNEMFSHLGTKRYNFKNETQLFKVIPHTSKFQKNRPASPERNTFEGS